MAGVFARGFLKLGRPVIPVTRKTNMAETAESYSTPEMVLVAVGEKDLHSVLEGVDERWRNRLVLLQNELLPRDWEVHEIETPTVIVVWFEKKTGREYKVLISSPVHGPGAPLLEKALEKLQIPCRRLKTFDELEFELVRKNVYILTTNICGLLLPPGTNVGELWEHHQATARAVADEVMDIQFKLIGHELDRLKLIDGMVEGILGDPAHRCTGRSAKERLERNLTFADRLDVSKMREIADLVSNPAG